MPSDTSKETRQAHDSPAGFSSGNYLIFDIRAGVISLKALRDCWLSRQTHYC
jgi:hypothetical protein